MPLVKLDKGYSHEKLDRVVRRKKSDYRIINKQIAKSLGVSERGILYKRKHGFFTFDELIKLFDYLEFTDEEIASVFRI
jgi:hypothetical protein